MNIVRFERQRYFSKDEKKIEEKQARERERELTYENPCSSRRI